MLVTLAAVLAPAAVLAQGAAPQPPEAQKSVQITLHPMPEPRPALKYQLLPPFLERRPGNAAVWWNRLLAGRRPLLTDLYEGHWEEVYKWMEIPIGDPREKEYRAKEPKITLYLGQGGLYSDMARAARFESCDWELPVREGNYISVLLPDVQELRTWGRLLGAKAHLEIAEGKYDQAVGTLQTGFALARHASQGQTLVHALVGSAIARFSMTTQIEQFIQQPDAPNLYWALATLPRPLIDYRPGFEAEANLLYLQFPELKDLDKKDLSAEQWRELLCKVVREVEQFGPLAGASGPTQAATAIRIVQGYPRAKQYLIEHDRPPAEVEAMPVAQVVLLYTVRLYEEISDDQFKWMFLPYAEGKTGRDHSERSLKDACRREIIPLASSLLPASTAAKEAETRTQWTLVPLRICEALRIYAAAHDGQLPDRLSDIREVPIPLNPYDDQPFKYHRDGNRAVLEAEHGPIATPWRYEITMVPKAK
jgi:hypothetical protein